MLLRETLVTVLATSAGAGAPTVEVPRLVAVRGVKPWYLHWLQAAVVEPIGHVSPCAHEQARRNPLQAHHRLRSPAPRNAHLLPIILPPPPQFGALTLKREGGIKRKLMPLVNAPFTWCF
jgi:hypothetical protein